MRQILAAVLVLAPLAAGAETLAHTWTPRTDREAEALRTGLMLYSLRESLRNGATVRQWGRSNLAALSQSGTGNLGVILQRGEDHSASLEQSGDGNAHAVLQAGRGGRVAVTQRGGEIGVTVQLGF